LKADAILKSVLLSLLAAGTFNLSWQIGREVQAANARQSVAEYGIFACKLGPSKDESSRFLIELGLILGFIGCYIRRPSGKLTSLAGLLFATGVYVLWWKYYFTLMEVSEAGEGALEHLLFLYGGVWLDLCIAAFLPILVVWQASTLALWLILRRKYS
jgi:hypothetical protein